MSDEHPMQQTADCQDRCCQHPSWCTDHRHEMVGPHGECHSESWRALPDEYGHRLDAHVSWFDGDHGAGAFIEYHHGGERFANLPNDALDVLTLLAEHEPAALIEMLLSLRAVIDPPGHTPTRSTEGMVLS